MGEIPWRRIWQPTPIFLLGEFHGQKSLAAYSPWDHKESDTTEQLTLPPVPQLLLAKMHSIEEAYGKLTSLTCLLTSKEPFCACVAENVSLTSRMRNMGSFISYLGRAQLFSGFSSWRTCPQGTNAGCSDWVHLSPASSRCLQHSHLSHHLFTPSKWLSCDSNPGPGEKHLN